MKNCSTCKIEKELSEFIKDNTKKDGLKTQCKSCTKQWRENNKDYYKEWKEKNKDYYKEWRENNKEKNKKKTENNKEKNKKKRENNKEKIKEYRKEYYQNNKEKLKEYYKNNKEKIKINGKEYYQNNKNKINDNKNEYQKNKRKVNPLFKLSTNIRILITNMIKVKGYKKNIKTETILGCSFDEFKLHLESKFQHWMSWDNYGNPKDGLLELNKSWDIDHIVPLSSAKTEEEIIKLNHYDNLQPLCSYTNRYIKRDKI